MLSRIKDLNPEIKTKSGLMLGLGETHDELFDVLADLREHDVDFLTLGSTSSREKISTRDPLHPSGRI